MAGKSKDRRAFDNAMKALVQVPKTELDEARQAEAEEKAKAKRKKSKKK